MGERISWIDYKNKKILYLDFSNLADTSDIIKIISEAQSIVDSNKDVLLLINIIDSRGNHDVISEFKKFLSSSKGSIKKDAVYCTSKAHKMFLAAIRMFTSFTLKEFDDLQKAKDYLVK